MGELSLLISELDICGAAEQFFKGDAGFEAGQRGAEAEVLTSAEGQVHLGVCPTHIEVGGGGELGIVSVAGGVHEDESRTSRGRNTIELGIRGRDPEEPLQDRKSVV